jgi:hypothetical protein
MSSACKISENNMQRKVYERGRYREKDKYVGKRKA